MDAGCHLSKREMSTDIEVQSPGTCVCEENSSGINTAAVVVPSLVVVFALVGILVVIYYRMKIKNKR